MLLQLLQLLSPPDDEGLDVWIDSLAEVVVVLTFFAGVVAAVAVVIVSLLSAVVRHFEFQFRLLS